MGEQRDSETNSRQKMRDRLWDKWTERHMETDGQGDRRRDIN